jgi:aryl-alcohol dehydrogenase-like predicted oxidoreductase
MHTRILGTSGLELTTIGLGTWAIGGGDWKFGWGPQDEDAAVKAVVRAVELGVNWVDTAAVYGNGRSEELVGKALRQLGPARRPLVATKCSRVIQPDGSIEGVLKRDSIIRECESSLKRLGVDVIDLYQLHWPLPEEDFEEGWQTLVDLRKQGKVRHIGVSNFSVEQLKRIMPIAPVESLQPPYSMIRPEIENETLPYCGENRIGVVCYSPMGKGLLTGKFSRERADSLPESDHRSRDPMFSGKNLEANLQLVEGLQRLAARHNKNVAELAIAWTLRRPEVTSAIVGARRPDQIEQTVSAGDWKLGPEDLAEIDGLLAERKKTLAAV